MINSNHGPRTACPDSAAANESQSPLATGRLDQPKSEAPLDRRPVLNQTSLEGYFYSPKKVASAIGVSESSLKRWCDAGHVKAFKTAGGHRRVPRSEVISFLKRKKIKLKKPESIGLPDFSDIQISGPQHAKAQLLVALTGGDELAARKIMLALFIEGANVAESFDRVIRPVFQRIGELWKEGNLDVYQERVASQICYNGLMDVRSVIPEVADDASVAIGAALEGDNYSLATTGVELCLRDFGWNASSLGTNIPIESLERAVADRNASLVWIAVAHISDAQQFMNKLAAFCDRLPATRKIVIGGNAVNHELLSGLPRVEFCENFAQLIVSARLT